MNEELISEALSARAGATAGPDLGALLATAGVRRRRRRAGTVAGIAAVVLVATVAVAVPRGHDGARAVIVSAGPTPTAAQETSASPMLPTRILALEDGKVVPLAATDGRRLDDGEPTPTLAVAPDTAFALTPDGSYLVATRALTRDGVDAKPVGCRSEVDRATLVGGHVETLVGTGLHPLDGVVDAMAVSPDGSTVAIALTTQVHGNDCTEDALQLRDIASGTLIRSWRGPQPGTPGASPRDTEFITRIRWSPDGRTLALSTGVCCAYSLQPKPFDTWAPGATWPLDNVLATPDGCSPPDSGGDFDAAGRLLVVGDCSESGQDPAHRLLAYDPAHPDRQPVSVRGLPDSADGPVSADATRTQFLVGGARLDGDRLVAVDTPAANDPGDIDHALAW